MTDQEQLKEFASSFNIPLTSNEINLLLKHLDLVIEKNEVINLTRISSKKDGLILHLLDSIILYRYFPSKEGKYLDMGTGAGFPGIDLAILSKRPSVFIDSVSKKINCVNSFISSLNLHNAIGVSSRLEDYAKLHKNEFVCITARALSSLPVLIEYATPFLITDGIFIVTKGNPLQEEITAGLKTAQICGLSLIKNDSIDLPLNYGHREIFVFKKLKPPSIKLPRKVGKASHDPIVSF